MVDPTATPPHRVDAASASQTDAREWLASLDDALVALLAKRLAYALQLEATDKTDPEPPESPPRPLDSTKVDPHSH